MEDVAGPERTHGVHREGWRLLQLAALVEPDRAALSPGACEKQRREVRDLLQGLALVAFARRLLERL